jgi:hypothetical protein
MIGRFVSTAALVGSVGVSALAGAERATFILTDGERKSGPVVFHTASRENLINGSLNLGAADGKEQAFPVDQVAVIDFVGGRPQRAELQALPSDSGTQVLVLRTGGAQQLGRFINMVGGDTVRWQNQAGEQQQYAIRDVSRIYLNPQSARTIWNANGTGRRAGVATSGTVLEAGATRVAANQRWTDTGISVKKGDRVAFRATGQIQWAQSGENAGPDGNDSVRRQDYPVTAMPVGGLIGKVGSSGPFPIGSNAQPIVMPAAGRLMLGVNDNVWTDNSGYYSVVITK